MNMTGSINPIEESNFTSIGRIVRLIKASRPNTNSLSLSRKLVTKTMIRAIPIEKKRALFHSLLSMLVTAVTSEYPIWIKTTRTNDTLIGIKISMFPIHSEYRVITTYDPNTKTVASNGTT